MAPSKIEDISSEASWIDEREDGGLVFERARVRTSRGYYWNMTDRARAALALTEGCTRRGRGKVFFFTSARARPVGNAGRPPMTMDAHKNFAEIPHLLYSPVLWTASELQRWSDLSQYERYYTLSANQGPLSAQSIVLPFSITMDDEQRQWPQLEGTSNARVSVYISPRPYVGLTNDMRVIGQWSAVTAETTSGKVAKDFVYQYLDEDAWDRFEQWAVDGVNGILDRLEQYYLSEQEGLVVPFVDVERMFLRRVNSAAAAGSPYGDPAPGRDAEWRAPAASTNK